jgi:hypothetical protein
MCDNAGTSIADPEEDPEDGITARVAHALVGRKKSDQVAEWDILWRLLFSSDEEVLPPGEYNTSNTSHHKNHSSLPNLEQDCEPVIEFCEIKQDFDLACQESTRVLQQVIDGQFPYAQGINPAKELWQRLIGDLFQGCKERISATAWQSSSESLSKSGVPTTPSSSVVAGPSTGFAQGIPTPAQTSRRQTSSAAPSLSSSGDQMPLGATGRATDLQAPSNLYHSTFDEYNVSDALRGGLGNNPNAVASGIHEVADNGAFASPSVFLFSATDDNSLGAAYYAVPSQQQDQAGTSSFSQCPTNVSEEQSFLLDHMCPVTGSFIDDLQGHSPINPEEQGHNPIPHKEQ